jgi:hypothetical protein
MSEVYFTIIILQYVIGMFLSIIEASNGSIFMLKGMVGWVRGYGICKGGFSVYGSLYIVFSYVNVNMKLVYCVVLFSFCGKVWVRVNGVKICKNELYVCVGKIEDKKNVVDITEAVYDHVFFS